MNTATESALKFIKSELNKAQIKVSDTVQKSVSLIT